MLGASASTVGGTALWRDAAVSRSRAPRRARVGAAPTRCSVETKLWFAKRLEAQGWERPKGPHTDLHPLVAETWAAMDGVYGAGVLETPLEPAPWLAEAAGGGASVALKLEVHQVTGSFKARGAAHKLLSLSPEQRRHGVITSSTGNHALAVIHACAALAAAGRDVGPAQIFVPATLAPAKAAKLRAAAAKAGAAIVERGTDCLEAEQAARAEAERSEVTYVSPYNDMAVAGGQGTLAVELLMALPPAKLDAVFVPVGGGGLVSGVAALLKSMHPGVRIVGCQPARSDVMRRSVAEGRVVELPWEDTLSDGTAGGVEEGSVTLEACSRFVDEWVTVAEDEIAAAMVAVHGRLGVRIEGAAGVAVAAYQKKAPQLRGQHVVIVCCGGNVAPDTLDAAYSMVKSRSSMGGSIDMG